MILEVLAPFLGAALLEVVHWHRLREKLEDPEYRAILASRGYWVITILTGVLGGCAALLYYYTARPELSAAELLVAGAAFPTLFKKLVAGVVDRDETKLGSERKRSVGRAYLAVG